MASGVGGVGSITEEGFYHQVIAHLEGSNRSNRSTSLVARADKALGKAVRLSIYSDG